MQKKRKIVAIIATIAVGVGSTGVYAEEKNVYEKGLEIGSILLQSRADVVKENESFLKPILTNTSKIIQAVLGLSEEEIESTDELEEEVIAEPVSEPIPEPRYGVDFTRIREIFPNRPFVKEVLTDEMQEHLNKREAETGIPGAVMVAQAIWEVGWELNTPKGGGKDSKNLFNIKNCNGDYVTMAGAKWQCYNSYMESVDAYIELITTQPRYAKAYEHIKNGGDMKTYYIMLGDAGYYESSKDTYSASCMSIINANGLLAK